MKGQFRCFSLKELEEDLKRVNFDGSFVYVPAWETGNGEVHEAYRYHMTKENGFFKLQRIRNPEVLERIGRYAQEQQRPKLKFSRKLTLPDCRAPVGFERVHTELRLSEYAFSDSNMRSGIDCEDMVF